MKKRLLAGSSLILSAILGAQSAFAAPAYMNDAETRVPSSTANKANLSVHKFPRTILSETQSLKGGVEQYTKYDIISTGSEVAKKVAQIQAANPDSTWFKGSQVAEYLEYIHGNNHCWHGKGIPFQTTGGKTEGCSVYAGHWLYQAGTKTSQAINTGTTTVKVADSARFSVGSYAVIYNAPAGGFANAEHVKIIGKNNSTKTLTIQRGFKSAARSHSSGSIIAQHVVGQGGSTLNWKFNVSTKSPKDGNGRTYSQAAIQFFKNNSTKDYKGNKTSVKLSGFLFDSDFHYLFTSKKADANNDLTTDHGIGGGVNWWGAGLDGFYNSMRNAFPTKYVVTGHQLARGFDYTSGTQMEGWPQSNGYHSVVPEYNSLSAELANYRYYVHHISQGPGASHVLTKTPTKIYKKGTGANSNKPFRFALGMGLLSDGYFGSQNSTIHPDVWYDEFAVYTNKNSSNYGSAVPRNSTDESAIRNNTGWLGNALGPYTRVYNESAFVASASLIGNGGTFDSNVSGWTGTRVNVSRNTGTKKDGAGSLQISKHTSFQSSLSGAMVKGPSASLTKNQWYTLVFTARANDHRIVKANVGGHGERFLVGNTWRRYIMSFKAKASGSNRISFNVGQDNIALNLDTVHLFKGNANVFRRDFQNGIVVVNGSDTTVNVNLGGTFQKILGTQDPSFNNGQSLNTLSLTGYDAAVLIRPKGSSGGSTTPTDPVVTDPVVTDPVTKPSDIEICGRPNFSFGANKGAYIWKNCTDNKWFMYVSPGGSSIDYSGLLWSGSGFNSFNKISLESHDEFSKTAKMIKFRMRAWASSADGFGAVVPANGNTCFKITSPSNAKVYLGPNKVLMSAPFKLNDLNTCS
ncbi:hypothetical protein [Halioxenophilus aromaticivorans]|uniref:Uncharacterized protein n=1 Tax=Halioxenophilus aromaticivorans TaxID=1306992 RepID=A0AAV3TZP5_9ALTE